MFVYACTFIRKWRILSETQLCLQEFLEILIPGLGVLKPKRRLKDDYKYYQLLGPIRLNNKISKKCPEQRGNELLQYSEMGDQIKCFKDGFILIQLAPDIKYS